MADVLEWRRQTGKDLDGPRYLSQQVEGTAVNMVASEVTAKKDRAAERGRDTSGVLTELPGSGSEELFLRI